MTSPVAEPLCALCGRPATVMEEPPRRTLARGLDPSDSTYSVTVLLPDVPLCAEHAVEVSERDRLIGWCDDPRCRSFGELGEVSPCGVPYKKLGAKQ